MLRLTLAFTLLATPLAALDKATLCGTSAEIVDAAVNARLDGKAKRGAIRSIKRSLSEEQAGFKPAVQPLVEWVYSEPDENMRPELATSYNETCLNN